MREKLFSITNSDFVFTYSRGSGKGGQKRNKTSSAARCQHLQSGAMGYSDGTRSQLQNKKTAWKKCINDERFRKHLRLEIQRRMGVLDAVNNKVDSEMENNTRVQVREGGVWVDA